jgi:hypothetical protein
VTLVGLAHGKHILWEDGQAHITEYDNGCEYPLFPYDPDSLKDIYEDLGYH